MSQVPSPVSSPLSLLILFCNVPSYPEGGAAELRRKPVFLQPGSQLPSLCLNSRLGTREVTYSVLKMPRGSKRIVPFPFLPTWRLLVP